MKRVFMIHRWSGAGQDDWRPWVKAELEKRGYEVIVPEMPNRDEPKIEVWVEYLRSLVGTPDSETYFVGHSIGCQTILRYLETIDTPVGGAVFVAGWFKLENLEDEEVERLAQPWMETPIDLARVSQVLPHSTLIISDNDPYGATELNKSKFSELGAKIIVLPGAGHVTEDDGYTTLPQVVEALEKQ